MTYDFDTIINRCGTDSMKFDGAAVFGKPADVLPLWVADMDFPAPPQVLDALHSRVTHGIFGYCEPDAAYFDALKNWFTGRFGYEFSRDWVVIAPGVVYALSIALRAFSKRNDAILIQEPVYYPFKEIILLNNRRLIVNELQCNEKYFIDFADFEQKIITNNVKIFILCSPHNPVSRCWTADELREISRICTKHNVLILSDEIHCDFIFDGNTHRVLPALCPHENILLFTAPSKTFNLAGLQLSNVFISNSKLRETFNRHAAKNAHEIPSALGVVACRAAYTHGSEWLAALNDYLWSNYMYLDAFLKTNMPVIRLVPPQATYLAWLDCRALGLSSKQLDRKLTLEAKLWLSPGSIYGASGDGFMRINIACPRTTLETCMERWRKIIFA
ncbi:MAG: pyridoxal phosphate-dependent aminotransferase [Clostridiales bacterium]|jgi:cystathionine beta-lyase|nr:pyridoxal phosphate-dependent aminotransferase [Clostridiales bacterium]